MIYVYIDKQCMYVAKYIFIGAIAQARNIFSSNSLLSGTIDPEVSADSECRRD